MSRRSRSVARVLLVAFASGAAFARGSAAAPADADSSIRSALAGDSVWVLHYAPDSSRLDDQHRPQLRVVAKALAAPEDGRRMAALLGGIDLAPGATPHTCVGCPGELRLMVGFRGNASNALGVRLWFPERAAFFSTSKSRRGAGFCDSIAPELLQLARRALASDTTLERYVLPPIDWGAKGKPDVGRTEVIVEVPPETIHRVAPKYPIEARRAGVEGTVMVQALVGADGEVKETHIQHSIPMLDAAAVDAVRRWRFKPALAQGKPLAVWVAIPVKFTLR